jgi:LlaMI restriction endonuclease
MRSVRVLLFATGRNNQLQELIYKKATPKGGFRLTVIDKRSILLGMVTGNKQDPSAQAKKKIIQLFMTQVKGKSPNTSSANIRHDGKGGHWLEKQMGLTHNAHNGPDLFGFEMKNATSSKTTFGDWSASYYLFRDNQSNINRTQFMRIFGAPNPLKGGRYSWSGKPVPKVGSYNSFGQILNVHNNGTIEALYSYSKDIRAEKTTIVPKPLQIDNLVLARWDASMMRERVERKFNERGWFKCTMTNGVYTSISFGPPITFETWISAVRTGKIFFDSGMYEGNDRPYSQWRADNKFWDSLLTETY